MTMGRNDRKPYSFLGAFLLIFVFRFLYFEGFLSKTIIMQLCLLNMS